MPNTISSLLTILPLIGLILTACASQGQPLEILESKSTGTANQTIAENRRSRFCNGITLCPNMTNGLIRLPKLGSRE